MSVEIQGRDEREMLIFKKKISLEDFSKALGLFNQLHKMFNKTDATYSDFVDYLISQGHVEVKKS